MTSENSRKDVGSKTQPYAWVILVAVFLLSVSAALFWFSPPPLAQPIIGTYIVQLGPENIQANFGALMSNLAWAALAAALVAMVVQNKIGIKWVMVLAGAFLLAGNVIAATSGSDYNLLVASRFVGGIGVGFAGCSATTAVSIWFADDRRALAMAIWATWVPVAMLVGYNLIAPFAMNGDVHMMWIIIGGITAVAFLLMLFAYRMPTGGQISTKTTSLKSGFKWLAQRQVIALLVCFFLYTYVSNVFVTYNVTFFTDTEVGMGIDPALASLVASVVSAFGITAPLFGAISDRIQKNRKYLMIVAGAAFYVGACLLAYKDWGMIAFAAFLVCVALANALLVATIRPMMPALVARGGVTAVTLGMSAIVFLGFFGQVFTHLFGAAIDSVGWASASWLVALPCAALMLVSALLVKPSGKQGETPSATRSVQAD
ncbi:MULTISPECIES: nitrate/nitrite transporter [unclassified Adlercreutzia]|uniref:MFS transporter n=1 Tax=unclassified Adlercreutzia TaxID=2636013 RepID=UPI0013ED29F8|nr:MULTISPECIES: MFS transporter [unclassified Adlercreutzia]